MRGISGIVAVIGLCAFSASAGAGAIIITADNYYDLYVDGTFVGSQNNGDGVYGWDAPETWSVPLGPGFHTLAVFARDESANSSSGIGLIATVRSDLGLDYVTDGTWRVESQLNSGWEQSGFDDSGWRPALVEGLYNTQPWTIFRPAMEQFAAPGAMWIWRDLPPYSPGYGFYNAGNHEKCWFRKTIFVSGATPTRTRSWGSVKRMR